MNIITPLILIIISIGTFFAYIDPNYRGTNLSNGNRSIQELQTEDDEYKKALNTVQELASKRNDLMTRSSGFSNEDLLKLEKLLPDNIDNIKLIIDMDNIGDKHNLVLKGAKLDTSANTDANKLGANNNNKYGTIGISFSVTASYEKFQDFLGDLEKSLRLVEITDLSITGNSASTGLYDFSVSLKTYWLK
jgi:Tfp pilus assembly protein PilO